jgi:hypothetical protein
MFLKGGYKVLGFVSITSVLVAAIAQQSYVAFIRAAAFGKRNYVIEVDVAILHGVSAD